MEGESFLLLGLEGRGEALWSDAALFAASSFVAANGGGNGDIERPDVEAEWAW